MAPKPLWEFTPIQFDPKGGDIITEYDMYSIEDAGLPKFDFLGIRNLSILADAVKLVKKIHNIDIERLHAFHFGGKFVEYTLCFGILGHGLGREQGNE